MSLLAEYKQYTEASRVHVSTTFGDQTSPSVNFGLLQYELLSILLRRHCLSNKIDLETFLENLNWYTSNSHQFAITDIAESLAINRIHRYIQRLYIDYFALNQCAQQIFKHLCSGSNRISLANESKPMSVESDSNQESKASVTCISV